MRSCDLPSCYVVEGAVATLKRVLRWKAGLAAIRQDRSAARAVVTTVLRDIDGLSPESASAGEA